MFERVNRYTYNMTAVCFNGAARATTSSPDSYRARHATQRGRVSLARRRRRQHDDVARNGDERGAVHASNNACQADAVHTSPARTAERA